MKQEFYWINRFNLVEFGGPFDTIDGAKADAANTYMAIGTIALDVVIVQAVESGSVNVESKWRPAA